MDIGRKVLAKTSTRRQAKALHTANLPRERERERERKREREMAISFFFVVRTLRDLRATHVGLHWVSEVRLSTTC